MHSWPRPLSPPEQEAADLPPPARLPVPPTRYLSATLARLRLRRRRRRHALPADAGNQDPRLERARAVLADAREQMPGLLRPPNAPARVAMQSPDTADLPADLPSVEIQNQGVSGDSFGRLEATVARLEDERRQLGSEVAALRLIVEELREALVRLDERTSAIEPVPAALPAAATAALQGAVVPETAPEALPLPVHREAAEPGRECVEVRLLSAGESCAIERLRLALEAEPAVERVGLTPLPEGEAILRLEVRSAQNEHQVAALLERAAPTAKPLIPATPGTFLLRLRPS